MEGKAVLGEALSRVIKRENSRPVKSSYGNVQQEFLRTYRKKCCTGQCSECGVTNRLEPFECPLQISDTKRVSYKKYVNQVYDDGSKVSQMELRKVNTTYAAFFREFYSFLTSEYLPHYYTAKWNNFHIKLAFDSIQSAPPTPAFHLVNYDWVQRWEERSKKTCTIQRDFSAVFSHPFFAFLLGDNSSSL
jgi:hypothetical protein